MAREIRTKCQQCNARDGNECSTADEVGSIALTTPSSYAFVHFFLAFILILLIIIKSAYG